MKKPEPIIREPIMDFNDMIKYSEKKHNFQHRDYLNRYGKNINESPRPEYLDYWHWLLEHQFYNVSNPCERYWSLDSILNDEKAPQWVKEITAKVKEDFIEYLNEEGGINVLIVW